MKYDAQLSEVQKILPTAKNILIALPQQPTVDNLAAGLALLLSLKQANKEVSISTEGTITVGHTNLFGVGQIKDRLPELSGGDFVITLSGVVLDGKVPAVEKMDYFPEGSDLNLVFKVLPGQKFQPTQITPHYSGGNFDLIFVLGANDLSNLGTLYAGHEQVFANTHLVNIDNKQTNTNFGQTKIVDCAASSLSEMISQILPSLGLSHEGDIATNILSGIFEATNHLQSQNVGADTYEAVANAVRAGGQKPNISAATNIESVFSQPATDNPEQTPQGFDLSKVFGITPQPQTETFPVPPVAEEEVPMGETATTVSPEEDWLTPKIIHGSKGPSLG